MIESLFAADQFSILDREVGSKGEKLVYLDSAATSLVPDRVISALDTYLRTSCSNIHRGAHVLAEESTNAYEAAREHAARFLDVDSPECAILTHGTTESLNMVALSWATHALCPGDLVVVAEDNHHSNIVCWQNLAASRGIELEWIPLLPDGILDYDAWCDSAERNPKLVALTHVSNVLGYMQPNLERILDDAKRCGSAVVLDAAQSAGHMPLSMRDASVDFLACSAHKMMGITGVGILACTPQMIDAMVPVYGGGGMVERVDRNGFTFDVAPSRFEAGTPAIEATIAFNEALSCVEDIGLARLAAHTEQLCSLLCEGLHLIPGISLVGYSGARRSSLVSFVVDGVHPHDVSQALSNMGIAVRAGRHCAMPLHRALGVHASIRASFAGYSSENDVRALLEAVEQIAERGW